MITHVEEITDVFSILHDGCISHWKGDRERLFLRVECPYLAQVIDPTFQYFTVELTQVHEMRFSTWPNPFDAPVETLASLSEIFRPVLEILSAASISKGIEVTCNQHDSAYPYCGGTLFFTCQGATVYDQNDNELSLEQLNTACQQYWNR